MAEDTFCLVENAEFVQEKIPLLVQHLGLLKETKKAVLEQWVAYDSPRKILQEHQIDAEFFIENYGEGVFDYFMGVIAGERELGNCPVMQELLTYLKFREIGADELFEICSHFRRSMIDVSYDIGLNSKELFDELSFVFDKNFRGILKYYTDTIFKKLVDARQEALVASQAREYFLSNMSHEIRTPLNAILGFVNLLIDEDISKKHRNYLEIILNSGENLLGIINDILDFSKLRSGEFTIEPKVFSIHDELTHAMELFVASANAKDITITSFIDPNIAPRLLGDSLRIKQIVSNFLSNAIKFTPEGGVVIVEASCNGGLLKISVKDNGIGIQKSNLENIFSAFSQVQSGPKQTPVEGSGLGLSISQQLAELMHGSVGVSSKPKEGSTFWVEIPVEVKQQEGLLVGNIEEFRELKIVLYIPRGERNFKHDSFLRYAEVFSIPVLIVESIDDETFDICIFVHEEVDLVFKQQLIKREEKFIALMSREYDNYEEYKHIKSLCFPLYCSKMYTAFYELLHPEISGAHAKKSLQKYKGHLLVAEDNEANQALIKVILQRYGLSFDLANNGLEAFELFAKRRYDLVLMDEQMPVMDGTEAVKKIREYEERKALRHTPVSALTANVIKGVKERDLLIGFDAFLGKPIVLKELEKVFEKYLMIDTKREPMLQQEEQEQKSLTKKIKGVDAHKLQKDLMLTQEELLMLLELFIKKMQKSLPELQKAIRIGDYKTIALKAHSIKGSSGNFRIEELLKLASAMEQAAKEADETFEYEKNYKQIEKRISEITII